ncbi:hypothetical protein N2152v2_002049 [Parachlorella kessleri]
MDHHGGAQQSGDDEVTLHLVARLLSDCGYQVTLARNGRQAQDVLEGGAQVDLVLTDLLMPELSGLELVDGLLHSKRFSHIPVVVMSSTDSQEAVVEAFEAGAQDYLIKPIRRQELTTLWKFAWRKDHPANVAALHGPPSVSGAGAEPSTGRTLASTNQPSSRVGLPPVAPPYRPQHAHRRHQQQQQCLPPLPPVAGIWHADPSSQRQQAQQAQQAQLLIQQQEGECGAGRPTSLGGHSMDGSDMTTQRESGRTGSGTAAGAGCSQEGEAQAPLPASDQLQGVLAAAAAVSGRQATAAPPASAGRLSVDLDIAPLNLAPPPLFVAGKGAAGVAAMPRGLQELAALGAQREMQRAQSTDAGMEFEPASAATTTNTSSLATWHHSASSAFSNFSAALVTPPCPRGGWGAGPSAPQRSMAAAQPAEATQAPATGGRAHAAASSGTGTVAAQAPPGVVGGTAAATGPAANGAAVPGPGQLQAQHTAAAAAAAAQQSAHHAAMAAAAAQHAARHQYLAGMGGFHHQQLAGWPGMGMLPPPMLAHFQQQQQQRSPHEAWLAMHSHPAAAATAASWAGMPPPEVFHHHQQQQQQQRFLQGVQAVIRHHQTAVTRQSVSAEAQAYRRAAVEKFRQKRKQRTFEKKVRYESRRKLAEARPRVKGQFVKADVAQAHSVATGRSSADDPAAAQMQRTSAALAAQPPVLAGSIQAPPLAAQPANQGNGVRSST